MSKVVRMPRATRAILSLCLLAFGTLPAGAQVFRERTDVIEIEVPVHVVRDGEPVRGLTKEDFELYEGKKKVPISGFEVVDLSELTPGQSGFAVSDLRATARRHFLLLFDLSFSDTDSVIRAREAAYRLVAESLHPTDLVAVAVYAQGFGSRLIIGFSSDRRQVELAIASLGSPQLVNRSPETLSIVLGEVLDQIHTRSLGLRGFDEVLLGGVVRRGEMIDATLGSYLEAVRDQSANEIRELQASDSNQVIALTRSFADLGRLMRGVSGRKHVVYLSEGFDSSLLLGGIADEEAKREFDDSAHEGAFWRVDTDRVYGSTRLQGDLAEMLRELRRADCVVHSVDIGGVRATGTIGPQRPQGEEGLFIMANETGGELYRNYNDLGQAMDRMLRSTSLTYLLTFSPKKQVADGAYHPIEVRLASRVPGAKLVHREGYFAPAPPSLRTPIEDKLEAAELILAGQEGGRIGVSVLAAPFKMAAGEKAFVPVLVEVNGADLIADHFGGLLTTEIYAYVLDPGGAVVDFLAHNVGVNLQKQNDTLAATGLKFYGELATPPGSYELRVLVRNAQTRAWGLRSFDLAVPDYSLGDPVLLPPFHVTASEGWLLARGESRHPYPFVVEGQTFVPSAHLRLAPGEEAPLTLRAYGVGSFAARVLDAAGAEVSGGRFELLREVDTGVVGLTEMRASFRPEGLAPGRYTLAVTLVDPASGRPAESLLPLEVEKR